MTELALTPEQEVAYIFNLPEQQTREGILRLAEYIESLPDNLGEDPFPLFHRFADGMYIREVHIPKGVMCVGKIHKNEYFINVLKGRLYAVSEFGLKELEAPCSFTAPAGIKHIVYTLEDSVWQDTHKVTSNTVEDAEKEIFCESYEEFDEMTNTYEQAIKDIGLSEDNIKAMLRTDDIIDSDDPIEIKNSEIEGSGAFLTKNIKKGSKIGIARHRNNRTKLGRYTNHSNEPNAECKINGESAIFYALVDIDQDTEITVDYRKVVKSAKELNEVMKCQE